MRKQQVVVFLVIALVHICEQCANQVQPVVEKALGPTNAFEKYLGQEKIKIADYRNSQFYEDNKQQPLLEPADLSCDFDSACCWTSANDTPLKWLLASGTPDKTLLGKYFRTSIPPAGQYVGTGSLAAETPDKSARLYSCPLECSDNVKITMHQWAAPETAQIQVCIQTLDSLLYPEPGLLNCKSVPAGKSEINLGLVEMSRIVIEAKNFVSNEGNIALLDSIIVDGVPCNTYPTEYDDTTENSVGERVTNAPRRPKTQPPRPFGFGGNSEKLRTECELLDCDFETGTCGYKDARNPMDPSYQEFSVRSGRFHNPLTGIRSANPDNGGLSYEAVFLKRGDEASLLNKIPGNGLDADRALDFIYYKATQGIVIEGCCDSECTILASDRVLIADKSWVSPTQQLICRRGTKLVSVRCINTGQNMGTCGFDNFQLLDPNSSDPLCGGRPAKIHTELRRVELRDRSSLNGR